MVRVLPVERRLLGRHVRYFDGEHVVAGEHRFERVAGQLPQTPFLVHMGWDRNAAVLNYLFYYLEHRAVSSTGTVAAFSRGSRLRPRVGRCRWSS